MLTKRGRNGKSETIGWGRQTVVGLLRYPAFPRLYEVGLKSRMPTRPFPVSAKGRRAQQDPDTGDPKASDPDLVANSQAPETPAAEYGNGHAHGGSSSEARASRSAVAQGQGAQGQGASANGHWATYLDRRPWPFSSVTPISWGVSPETDLSTDGSRPVPRNAGARNPPTGRKSRDQVMDELAGWLGAVPAATWTAPLAREAIAWVHCLARQRVPEELATRAISLFAQVADDARGVAPDDPVTSQLLGAELPLSLAWLLPNAPVRDEWLRQAIDTLTAATATWLDERGLVRAEYLDCFRALFACWTRCAILDLEIPRAGLNAWRADVYRKIVVGALHLCRADGTQLFSTGRPSPGDDALFRAAARVTGDASTIAFWKAWRSETEPSAAAASLVPHAYSAEAEVAVLRPDWSPRREHFALAIDRPAMRSELGVAGHVLWQGEWTTRIRCDGELLEPTSGWSELCWVTDEDVDVLEWELEFQRGWRLQRQLVLARHDRFLLLGDALLGDASRGQSAQIEYESSWPLSAAITFRPASDTWEGTLAGKKPLARIVPLALPEWKSERAAGTLRELDGRVVYSRAANARRLHAPLWVDLDPARARRPLTWRRLTVGEQLRIQPADVAAGYRVAVGKEQWVVYRSLAPQGNRTLLGQNLATEFLCARFLPTGFVERLIEIE